MGSIDWLPIETFDGRTEEVLIWDDEGDVWRAAYRYGVWLDAIFGETFEPGSAPTHWAEINPPEGWSVK